MVHAQHSQTSEPSGGAVGSTEAEFDHYARRYEELHSANIGVSGEEPAYFAEYKVREVARCLRGSTIERILDFGCGVGGSTPFFRSYFPDSALVGVDVSQESLRHAEERHGAIADFRHLDPGSSALEPAGYDVAFTACVFHHIPPQQHDDALRQIHHGLASGGHFFLFEHNPLNPLTVRAVNTCPFDADAILIRAGEMARRVKASGFSEVQLRYCTFFPRALSAFRPIEPWLGWLPLGAQYYLWARP